VNRCRRWAGARGRVFPRRAPRLFCTLDRRAAAQLRGGNVRRDEVRLMALRARWREDSLRASFPKSRDPGMRSASSRTTTPSSVVSIAPPRGDESSNAAQASPTTIAGTSGRGARRFIAARSPPPVTETTRTPSGLIEPRELFLDLLREPPRVGVTKRARRVSAAGPSWPGRHRSRLSP